MPALVSEVTTLLSTRPEVDASIAIGKIIWEEARHYRVSITINELHADEEGHRNLFAGYDTVVAGSLIRRRAETFKISDLRAWMEAIAQKAIAVIHTRTSINV